MAVKDKVIQSLKEHTGEYVSGEDIARELGVSRAAIWKGVQSLQKAGYPITAVRNRGYLLASRYDILDAADILDLMPNTCSELVKLEVRSKTGSTNNDVRAMANSGAEEFTTVVAGEQTSGKGRRGRQFYSMGDIGVYLSILLKPNFPLQDSSFITCTAAVAVCRAIERTCHEKPKIKWVNDVYLGDRKVCGILTEGFSDLEIGGLKNAVVGIGVNVYEPEGGFPHDICAKAGSLTAERQTNLRNELAASIISEIIGLYRSRDAEALVEEYRDRSFLPGKHIYVMESSNLGKPAMAVAIEDDLSLRVRYENGDEECLNSGEVSIRLTSTRASDQGQNPNT